MKKIAVRRQQRAPWPSDTGAAYIVYDGDCPFCNSYVRLVRLRETMGPVQLVNARDGGAIVAEVMQAGYDLDEGMILKYGGRFYHGADCIHLLAGMTAERGAFNHLNRWIFRKPARARVLYPWLRAGRNAALRLLGRRKLRESAHLHPSGPVQP